MVQFKIPEGLSFRSAGLSRQESAVSLLGQTDSSPIKLASEQGECFCATFTTTTQCFPLTNPGSSRYHSSSLLYGADLGFHAEWLRDEPYEATTTGSEGNFWSPGVNSRPAKGEHEIRGADF
jgi:hypothetical protein